MRAIELSEESLARVACGGEGWVAELLERLPVDQRDAIRARVLEERPYGDIARELQTSQLVIRKRVSRGLAALRVWSAASGVGRQRQATAEQKTWRAPFRVGNSYAPSSTVHAPPQPTKAVAMQERRRSIQAGSRGA